MSVESITYPLRFSHVRLVYEVNNRDYKVVR